MRMIPDQANGDGIEWWWMGGRKAAAEQTGLKGQRKGNEWRKPPKKETLTGQTCCLSGTLSTITDTVARDDMFAVCRGPLGDLQAVSPLNPARRQIFFLLAPTDFDFFRVAFIYGFPDDVKKYMG